MSSSARPLAVLSFLFALIAVDLASAEQVSVWDSDVSEDLLAGIYPIGGTGESNVDFVTTTLDQGGDQALQLGIRIWSDALGLVRFDGDRTYRVPSDAVLGGVAAWSYDLHLDFGTSYLESVVGRELEPQTMADLEVILRVDRNPGSGVQFHDTEVPAVIDPIQLLQSRQNVLVPTFYGGPYPEMLNPGRYEFVLELRQPTSSPESTLLLSTSLVLVVDGPLSIPISSPLARFIFVVLLVGGAVPALRRLGPS